MAGSQISTSVSIIDNLKGYLALSLTEYTTSAAAAIAAGSIVEIAGAFFTFAGDETPNASSWTAIATGSTAYLALTASGTAGSQIVNAAYTATAPTWRDDLQGWYASAASSVRIVASVYKAEATSYYPKYVLTRYQVSNHIDNLKVSGYIDSDTVSASSSISIVGYPAVAVSDDATALTSVFPIGSIVAMLASSSTAYNVRSSVTLRTTGTTSYIDSSYSTSGGTILTGSWVTIGRTDYATSAYLAQRIS